MFSRTATCFIAGAIAGVGTSDFAAITDSDLGDFAAELDVAPEGTLPTEPAGLTVLPVVPAAAFEPTVAPETGFAAELPAGFALALDVADRAGELGTEPDDDLGAGGAGLTAEFAGGAGLAVCVSFDDAAPAEAT